MNPPRPVSIMRVKDVLAEVGVCRKTLHVWRTNGNFPRALRLGPNTIAWRRADVEQWLNERDLT